MTILLRGMGVLEPNYYGKIELHTPKGNAPTCPACKSWNALLEQSIFNERLNDLELSYKCRDCGFVIPVFECVEIVPK